MPDWRTTHPGVEELTVAVMGCVVNGPGESKHADIGISLPGTFEEPVAPVFVDGKLYDTFRGDDIVERFIALLEEYVARRCPAPSGGVAPERRTVPAGTADRGPPRRAPGGPGRRLLRRSARTGGRRIPGMAWRAILADNTTAPLP